MTHRRFLLLDYDLRSIARVIRATSGDLFLMTGYAGRLEVEEKEA